MNPVMLTYIFGGDLDGIENPHPDGFTSSYPGIQDAITIR